MKVLVVDDNRVNADMLGCLFETMGHDVHLAYSGEEALTIADEIVPNLIVLDINMPGINGLQTCKLLKQNDKLGRTVIIAQTGHGNLEMLESCREAGFDEHWLKPVPVERIQNIDQKTA